MRRTGLVALLVVRACLPGAVAAGADAAASRPRGDSTYVPPGAMESLSISSICAVRVSCHTARQVVNDYLRLGDQRGTKCVDGFRCRFGGAYPGTLRCSRGSTRIIGNGE